MALTELFTSDRATTVVFSGGTTAPAGGTQETWLVASSAMFGAAAAGVSQFHVADPVAATEIIAVTNVSGSTWTVTRGAESTTPVAHAAGFTVYQVVTSGFLASPVFSGAVSTGGLTGATAASRYVGATASGAPVSGTFAVGDFVVDQTGKFWICTAAGTPGTWAQGGGGGVASVAAADTSVVIGGTGTAPTVRTGTLDVIAADHPAAADWSNNSHKITSLANGSGAQDAAAFGQTPAGGTTVTIGQGGTGQVTQQAAINALSGTQTSGYVLGSDGTNVKMVPDGGVTIKVPAPTGLTATDTPHVTTAITSLVTALASGPATLQFQDGTYQIDSNSAVIRSVSGFAVRGTGATVIAQAPNRAGLVNNVTGDLLVIADCTDFRVEGITFDGVRDTVAPITALTHSATSGQPSVTVANGQGSRYIAGQKLFLFGGLGTGEQNQSEGFGVGSGTPLVVSSITTGGGFSGGDLITFTTNLANSYTHVSGSTVSDGFGPYACTGAYLTPYQCGSATVAGRALAGEDQQNGLHLLNCQRFTVTRCEARNIWESGIKCGDLASTALADGCSQGTISDCTVYHGYDQGVSLWVTDNVTVTGCVLTATGWAGVSMSAISNYCTVTGNEIANSIYRVPNDTASGCGIAIEGGLGNSVTGNVISGVYGTGILLLGTPLIFSVTPSNAQTLSSFLGAQTAAGTSVQIGSTTGITTGTPCSLLDGERTEAVTIASVIDSSHVTFAEQTRFSHNSGVYLCQRLSQENVIEGNAITGCQQGSGIDGRLGVRTLYKSNIISGWGTAYGVTFDSTTIQGLPSGTYLGGNGSHLEDCVISGGNGDCVRANGVSGLLIRGNRIYGPQPGGIALNLYGLTDSIVAGNYISEVTSQTFGKFGIQLSSGGFSGNVACVRVTLTGNVVRRCSAEGIIVFTGDSLTITGNVVQSCGGGAGISLGGVTNSVIAGNVSNSNQAAGILLQDNSAVFSKYNRVTGNTCRDDGSGYDITTGNSWTQQYGIRETGSSNDNLFTGNECDSNGAGQLVTSGAASYAWANVISGTPAGGLPIVLGGTGSTTRNFAGLLTPTAVKTTTYSAAAGDYVPCDTTSGSFTVTLPNAPADLTVVGVKQVIQGGTNTVTVACAGSDVYNKTGGATSATLTLLAQGLLLQYKAAGGIWYVLADDLALSQLDARYLTLSGGTMTGSMGVPVKTVSTTNTTVAADWITLCNAASAGFTNNLPDATTVRAGASYIFKKTDATANEVQLLPAGSQTVDGASYLVLAAANAMADLRSDGSNWQAF